MRKLISGMKISLDGKTSGSEGYADWVTEWSEDYGFAHRIDACVLGGKMYPGYEAYWTAIQNNPAEPLPMTGKLATARELEWATLVRTTPHHVVSNGTRTASWEKTKFLGSLDDIDAMKKEPGKDIYLMGGASIVSSAINAGLLDELHLIVYPIIIGSGQSLFNEIEHRKNLSLLDKSELGNGLMKLSYAVSSR